MEEYLQAELKRLREDPLTHGHPPNAMQKEFLKSVSRRRIVVAANRVGKTEAAIRDKLWTARGEHPYRQVRKCSQMWIGSPDYPSYFRYHRPAFDMWCPPKWIVGAFHESEKWVDIRRVDGGSCRIFFLSYDMPRSKWQGAGVDDILLDEECPEDILSECLARIVTTRGSITLTFTPVTGIGWWYDRIFKPAQEGLNNWHAFSWPLATRDPTKEAEFEVGYPLVNHLTREQIIEFASEYPDEDERAIRVFGEVRGRQGLVYKQYRKPIHRIPAFPMSSHFDLWGGVDPGYHGFAAVIGAIDPMNRVYVVKEFYSQGETTLVRFKELAKAVRSLRTNEEWEAMGRPTIVFFVDTEDPQVVLELNVQAAKATELAHAEGDLVIQLVFAALNQGLKARRAGFMRVQQLLAPQPVNETPPVVTRERPVQGEPLLYFFDSLYSEWQGSDGFHKESRTLWELSRYAWRRPNKGTTVQNDDADEFSADGAHAMAAMRYLIMARLGPVQQDVDDSDKGNRASSDLAREMWDDIIETEERLLQEQGYV